MARRHFSSARVDYGSMILQPFRAQCEKCNEDIFFNLDPNGTEGANGDWCTIGVDAGLGCDYGCTDDDEHGNGHWPAADSLEYDPHLTSGIVKEPARRKNLPQNKPIKRRTVLVETSHE